MKIGDVVQFNENHKWCGVFGYVARCDDCGKNGMRYQIAVPIPEKGTAFIFVMNTEKALDKIGETDLMLRIGDED